MGVRPELRFPDLGHSSSCLLKARANQETRDRGRELPTLLCEARMLSPGGGRGGIVSSSGAWTTNQTPGFKSQLYHSLLRELLVPQLCYQ